MSVKLIQRLMMPGTDLADMPPLRAPYEAFNSVFDRAYMGREEFNDAAFLETLDVFRTAPKTSTVGRNVSGGMHVRVPVYDPELDDADIAEVCRFMAEAVWRPEPLKVGRIFFLTLEKHLEEASAWLSEECKGNTRRLVKEPTYFVQSAYLRALCHDMEKPLPLLPGYTHTVGWLVLKPFPMFYTISRTMFDAFSKAYTA